METSDEAKPELLLGHLSMLLDVTVSPCGGFVVTCDRDEKIRISHYPNAYNIHGFCLGHTDFITRIVPVATENEMLLVSSSGDGSVKLWNMRTCEELCSRQCHTDAGVDVADCDAEPRDENGEGQLRTSEVSAPVVSSVKCFRREMGDLVLVASVEGCDSVFIVFLHFLNNASSCSFQGLLAYAVDLSARSIRLLQKIVSSAPLWDYDLDSNGDLWSVQNGRPHLSRRTFDEKSLQFLEPNSAQVICEIDDAFWEGKRYTYHKKLSGVNRVLM